MKKLYAILAAGLAIVSCTEKKLTPEVSQDAEKAEVTFCIQTPATKATVIDANDEIKVNAIQVFVFNTDGSINAMSGKTEGNSVTLACGVGDKTIAAVVNGPEIAASTTYTLSRLQRVTSSFADNAVGSFVMYGAEATTLSARAIVAIKVKRLVSKIVIKEITRDFAAANYAAIDSVAMDITGIYLKKVAGQASYGSTATISTWYNDVGNTHYTGNAAVLGMIADYDIQGVSLKNGETYDTAHTFYAYPNPEKTTLLTIETILNGNTLYYPLALPALESNKIYTLTKLTLSRPGGNYDDRDTIIFMVEVEEWEEGDTWEEIY